MLRVSISLWAMIVVGACSSEPNSTAEVAATGGASQPGTGGIAAKTGGAPAITGGSTASGGTPSAAAGGAFATGGAAAAITGGSAPAATGGASPSATGGGAPIATGGAPIATGGASTAMGGSGGTVTSAADLIAAPDGEDAAPGTLAEPTTLTAALTRLTSGHTIFLRGGTYAFDVQITIPATASGENGKTKTLAPYNDEKPKLDFSSQPYGTGSNPRGLQINASYWHVRGLEVLGSADNGIYVAGNSNVIEACVTHENRDTGLQLGRASSDLADIADWPSDNLILNCESYDNYDAPPGGGENADGFAAKLTVGPGNVFRGCVAHHNIDDGWDLYTKPDTGPIGPVTIDQCVAYQNGVLTDGTSNENGDRNGFKLGGDDIAVAHVVTRSIAFENGKNGFTWNSNPGAIRASNNLAFDNAEGNFKFGDNSTQTAAVFTNNVSFWTSTASTQSDKTVGTDAGNSNVWWNKSESQPSVNARGLIVTAADFASSLASPAITRNADGSLNLAAFALAAGSDLIDAGQVPAGALPFDAAGYYAGTPDLGAVEKR